MEKVTTSPKIFSALPLGIFAECARFVKVSFIVGSKAAFFSLGHCITPLVGFYSGIGMTIAALAIRGTLTGFTHHLAPHIALAYHIPTFFAALYMATIAQSQVRFHQRAFMAVIIAGCFVSFGFHAVGSQALPYTLFWFIPLCSTLIAHNNTFVHALASTFTAHAVGSVIWLYTIGPVSPAAWLALMPVVMVERLLFASGMTLSIATITAIKKMYVARTHTSSKPVSA